MTINIYRYDWRTGYHELVATFYDDATVEGTTNVAERLRTAVDLIESRGEDPALWVQDITDRMLRHWDNGFFRVEVV